MPAKCLLARLTLPRVLSYPSPRMDSGVGAGVVATPALFFCSLGASVHAAGESLPREQWARVRLATQGYGYFLVAHEILSGLGVRSGNACEQFLQCVDLLIGVGLPIPLDRLPVVVFEYPVDGLNPTQRQMRIPDLITPATRIPDAQTSVRKLYPYAHGVGLAVRLTINYELSGSGMPCRLGDFDALVDFAVTVHDEMRAHPALRIAEPLGASFP